MEEETARIIGRTHGYLSDSHTSTDERKYTRWKRRRGKERGGGKGERERERERESQSPFIPPFNPFMRTGISADCIPTYLGVTWYMQWGIRCV